MWRLITVLEIQNIVRISVCVQFFLELKPGAYWREGAYFYFKEMLNWNVKHTLNTLFFRTEQYI